MPTPTPARRHGASRIPGRPALAPTAGALLALLLVCALVAPGAPAREPGPPSDAPATVPAAYDPGPPRYAELERSSLYLTMRDGTRIAVDLWLPRDLPSDARLPAILHQTRYWRSAALRWPASWLLDGPDDTVRAFVEHGYAWLSVDARGSGASFGSRPYPWSPDEVSDGAEVVDWIVAQPWSNGKVGSFGTSYDGTTAEFLATTRHPAVVAVAPRFSLFDAYTDIAFPGGLRLAWFTEKWGAFNAAIDRNQVPAHLQEELGWRARLVSGVRPVDGPDGERLLEAALRDHAANYDVDALSRATTYRDDPNADGLTVDAFSPHTRLDDLRASGAAVFSWSGWFDGGYSHAAIKRFLSLGGPDDRLILGPWDHGGRHQVHGARSRPTDFPHVEQLLKFFDHHTRDLDTGLEDDAPVHYYTLVQGVWKAAESWPPPAEPVRLYLAPDGSLAPEPSAGDVGADRYTVDPAHGTGDRSRWNSLMGLPVFYDDRAAADALLQVYETPPLDRDLEVTGHPMVTLYVASSAEDGAFLAYLEDVGPGGSVTYVSEGVLRALHRTLATTPAPYRQVPPWRTFRRADGRPLRAGSVEELVIDLLPTSYLFRAGHRIRLALAGADADHFAAVPAGEPPPTWAIQRTRYHPSHLQLPVVTRGSPVAPGAVPGT